VIRREVRVEHEAKQAPFGARLLGDVQAGPRLWLDGAVLHDADAAHALGEEDAAIRREIQRPRRSQARGQHLHPNVRRPKR